MVIMLILMGLLIGGLVGFNMFKNAMMAKYMASAPVPPTTVSTMKVGYETWQPELAAVGTLRAVRGVDVTTEVAGLVRSVEFKSGDQVANGKVKVLAQLNADADVAQLHALEAAAELAATVYERDKAQLAAQLVSQAQVDADAADLKARRAQVEQQTALIAKKTIRAPFAGKLGISTVNPGQYLNAGDKLVTLQALDPVYVDFMIPQRHLPLLAVGRAITLTADAYKDTGFDGKISAISPAIDPATRNVRVEATVPNPKRLLLPGMYATIAIHAGSEERYLTLPQTAIIFNPYGNTVFVVKAPEAKDAAAKAPPTAQQVFVTTGPTRGDQIAILGGIDEGAEVVVSGGSKLKNGTPLVINNAVQPANDPNPKPQER